MTRGANRSTGLIGIAYIALGFFVFAGVDTQAKLLTETLHPIQVVWARQSGLLFVVLLMLSMRGPAILRTDYPVLQIGRGILAALSAGLFITAISFVPIADAIAVSFVAPFFVTVLAALILRESVGVRRWTAIAIGFLATLIILRPGLGVVHPAAMLVVLAAFVFALRQVVSRYLSGSDRTMTTLAYTSLAGSALITLALPFVWVWPTTQTEIVLLVTIAVLAAFGEFLIVKALELTEAVVLAPLQYTLLIWGTMYGVFVFGEIPDIWTTLGALIIVATGLYTFHRERTLAKNRI